MSLLYDGKPDIDTDIFRTTDTPLAAFLHTVGIKLLDIEVQENGRGAFLFEQPPDSLVDNYRTGKAECSALLFHKSYRYLVRQIAIKKEKKG